MAELGDDRYSTAYAPVDLKDLPPAIREALAELASGVVHTPIRTVNWNQKYIAIAFDLPVDLPARGPVLDIRAVEPVMLVFHRVHYPRMAPMARSDRQSLPADQLPHLNPVQPGQPPWLCLHRGDIDDWFTEHSLAQLVVRVGGWFRNAAAGRLIPDGDDFEHTRLAGAAGTIVFDPRALDNRVVAAWEASGGGGHGYVAVTFCARPLQATGWDATFGYQVDWTEPEHRPREKVIGLFRRINQLREEDPGLEPVTFGLFAWPSPRTIELYFAHLPSTYGQLIDFARRLDVPVEAAVADYLDSGGRLLHAFPLMLAVPRPRRLISTASSIEWLSFVIVAAGDAPSPEDQVVPLSHRRPLTPAFAAHLSAVESSPLLERPLVLGCGALGSKMSLHLARSGVVAQRLVDRAALTPHHLVRHALQATHLGKNKATAMAEVIAGIYAATTSEIGVEAVEANALDVLADGEKIRDRSIVLDASASATILESLVVAQTIPRVCRAEIGDAGKLGILMFEGRDRNPRLDDLQAHLFDLARTEPIVQTWLARRSATDEHEFDEIDLGLGCSSATLRLGDESIALHAAAMMQALRTASRADGEDSGWVVLTRASGTKGIRVPPVACAPTVGGQGWVVRIADAALATMRTEFARAAPRETGGILIGYLHRKRRILYVTHVLTASRRSHGSRRGFLRGADYQDAVDGIEQATGRLGYVGEWHTHPDGDLRPSHTDLASLEETCRVLRMADLPAHIIIVGPDSFVARVRG